MSIRNTINLVSDQVRYYSQVRRDNLSFLQFQASTGLKHSRPSDDPLAAEQLFSLKRTVSKLDIDLKVMEGVEPTLNLSVSNLTEAHQIVRSVQRIALDARQADPAELPILANEVDDLLDRLVNLGNSTVEGRYQYGGQNDKTQPFVKNPNGSNPPYLYQGSDLSLQVSVGANVTLETLKSGRDIFQSSSRAATFFLGQTGAAAGTGTDSGVGTGELLVSHTLTTFAAGSGVAAGSDSAALDTIIGPAGAHQLTLVDQSGTGTSGVVRLNDGLEIAWTSGDNNLRVEDELGRVVYLDTTGIAAGFNGAVDITSTGTLSTDGGTTAVPINFSGNQVIQNSDNQQVTNVDSTGINRVGTESLEYRGTSDLFATLTQLRDDLLNERNLQGKEWDEAIVRHDQDLERHGDRILSIVGEQSVSLETVAALKTRNRTYHLEVSQVVNEVEGADLTDVVLQLQQEQNLLEYTYAISSTILQQNILDYLR